MGRAIGGGWGSTDGTVEAVERYGGKVQRLDSRLRGNDKEENGDDKRRGMTGKNLGERKQELIKKAKGHWILVLDADERVSEELREEMKRLKDSKTVRQCVAYRIPYQNYVFGKPVYHGGEKYAKVRLFRHGYAKISSKPLHEEVKVILPQKPGFSRSKPGFEDIGTLRGIIHHHSYRTPWQLVAKFTRYAWVAAEMYEIASSKTARNDMLRKLFLYGPHMFWARFVKEKGYKDGWRGLVLALAFGYMETTDILVNLYKTNCLKAWPS